MPKQTRTQLPRFRRFARRRVLTRRVALAQFVTLSLSLNAFAADPVDACITHHVDGQVFRNDGRLQAAQIEFAECSSASCPVMVRDACITLLGEVGSALPSVVLSAVDETGTATSEVMVRIDDSSELVPVTGRSFTLDPGEHRLHFRQASGSTLDLSVTLVAFEHDRQIQADFRLRPSKADPLAPDSALRLELPLAGSEESRVPWVLVSGGAALAALGAFTYFSLAGNALERELVRCKPNCDDRSDLDRLRTRYLIADVSLGVALVALGVGAYAWLTSPTSSSSLTSRDSVPQRLRWESVASRRSVELRARGEF